MSFVQITNILDEAKNSKGIVTKAKFNKIFEILPAVDDGNCLFSSVEQLFSHYDLHELRQLVCDYYKTFDKFGNYPENSIKAKLQIQMISDNQPEFDDDEDFDENAQLHEQVICTDFEWAGVMDVIALADILNINIILMIMGKQGYTVQPFLNKNKFNTICIKFNGKDHFEPLLPKFEVDNPRSSSSNKSRSSSSNSKKNALASAKDISSETRKLISQIEHSPKNALDTAKDISSETLRLISQMENLGFNKKSTPPKKSTRASTRRNTGRGTKRKHN